MKFSIITCTYNSEGYVQKNIDSVKNQIFNDFEHIFIDGFSTDKTIEIIKKYKQEFPEKVKLFQFDPKGIANAMNNGIEKSNGEYIIHLHSDDSFYTNNVLSQVNEFITNNNYPDLVYGKAKFINEDGLFKIIPHRKIYHKIHFWLLLLTNYIPHQAVFIKKEVFSKFGKFDEQYKNCMDYELWLRLSKNRVRSLFLNVIVCNFSIRESSQSSIGKENSIIENMNVRKTYVKSKFIRLFITIVTKINDRRKLI